MSTTRGRNTTTVVKVSIALSVIIAAMGVSLWWAIDAKATADAALKSTAEALTDYALSAETEIDAYTRSVAVLGTIYQEARNERDALSTKLAKHDFNEMAKRKPRMLERRINNGSNLMFLDIVSASTYTPSDAELAQTGTD